jgi:hypothetical protein
MTDSIVITGLGVISAIGNDKAETLASLQSEKTGVGALRYLRTDHHEFPVGEVKMSDDEMKQKLGISAEPTTRTSLMGMIAMQEALQEAALLDSHEQRVILVSGTTVGGMDKSEQYYLDYLNNDCRNDYIKTHDCGATTELIADYFGIFSMVTSISTACSSAANAIILGANLIRSGQTDIAVVGGTECITKFHLNGFNVAAGVANLGSGVTSAKGNVSKLPSSARLAASYELPVGPGTLAAALDADYYFSGKLGVSAGVHYGFKDLVFVRAGYRYATAGAAFPSHLALGLGVKWKGVGLDVSYLTANAQIGNSLCAGLSYRF